MATLNHVFLFAGTFNPVSKRKIPPLTFSATINFDSGIENIMGTSLLYILTSASCCQDELVIEYVPARLWGGGK